MAKIYTGEIILIGICVIELRNFPNFQKQKTNEIIIKLSYAYNSD